VVAQLFQPRGARIWPISGLANPKPEVLHYSVVDPHCINADSDPAFYLSACPDPGQPNRILVRLNSFNSSMLLAPNPDLHSHGGSGSTTANINAYPRGSGSPTLVSSFCDQ
jgi:hypothetical protein